MPVLSTDDGTAQFNAGCLRSRDLAKLSEPVFQALNYIPMVTVTSTCHTYSGVRAVCDVMQVFTVQVEDIVPGVAVNVQNTEQEQLVKKNIGSAKGALAQPRVYVR